MSVVWSRMIDKIQSSTRRRKGGIRSAARISIKDFFMPLEALVRVEEARRNIVLKFFGALPVSYLGLRKRKV